MIEAFIKLLEREIEKTSKRKVAKKANIGRRTLDGYVAREMSPNISKIEEILENLGYSGTMKFKRSTKKVA